MRIIPIVAALGLLSSASFSVAHESHSALGKNGGQVVEDVCYLSVPHDMSGNPAINSGQAAGYTVYP